MKKMLFCAALFNGLLLSSTQALAEDCPATSTESICVDIRRAQALKLAIEAQTAAMAAQTTAVSAQALALSNLNKARFEVPNSAGIEPNTGKADLATGSDDFLQKWLAAEASRFAARAVAERLTLESSKPPKPSKMSICTTTRVVAASPGYARSASERARLRQELAGLADQINAYAHVIEPGSMHPMTASFPASTAGAAIQALASIAGFFVTDFSIKSAVATPTDLLVINEVSGALTGVVNPLDNRNANSANVDDEVKSVRDALDSLSAAILSIKQEIASMKASTAKEKASKATLEAQLASATAFETSARNTLGAVFVTPATGDSTYAQAVLFDSEGATKCLLQVKTEIAGGVLASAVKRFSSGTYTLVAAATLDYQLTQTATGQVATAGSLAALCRWNVPVKDAKSLLAKVSCKTVVQSD